MKKIFIHIYMLYFIFGCAPKEYKYNQDNTILSTKGLGEHSTTIGNLITTAIKEVNDLDIVLYPNTLIQGDSISLLNNDNSQDNIVIQNHFPAGEKDQFIVGYMKGSDLTNFIYQRTIESFELELEVDGINYEIIHKGGLTVSESYQFNNRPIDKNKYYKIAISKHFIFSNETFPSYKYRNSIDRIFIDTNTIISARNSLKQYLASNPQFPLLNKVRAQVKATKASDHKLKKISQIQGMSHLSPYLGDYVTTTGIVTAFSMIDTYPGGYVAYIQSIEGDSNPETSEGIKLYFNKNNNPNLQLGDYIRVSGKVYEETNHILNGLTTTSIRNISNIKIISINNSLPEPKILNNIPNEHLSTYRGDLNLKKKLNLKDGLDFWESLEGMRITITNPRIVGFRGGKEQSDDEKSHLTLFLVPNGHIKSRLDSQAGGILADTDNHIFNPHIIPLASSTLTKGLQIGAKYEIGDIIEGQLTGLISFTKNLFGDAEFLMVLPTEQEDLKQYYSKYSNRVMSQIADRAHVGVNKSKDTISIASYNVKNLSPENKDRIRTTGKMIKTNLGCPDILGLIEIQDNNGENFSGGSLAQKTLDQLIKNTPCDFDYEEANIDPLLHREGGVPGGNIRVALLFNPSKLNLSKNPLPDAMTETIIDRNGNLNYNPGRIGANSPTFKNTRKSLVVQFTYQNDDYYIIVNHLNSKLSDTSHFSSIWPMAYPSEVKRSKMAHEVNKFVRRIEKYNSKAKIAVIGDFNEFINQPAMRVLEGDNLYNLMRTIPKNDRYTTNHNGNSQPLDYIFVNKNLYKNFIYFKPLHLNSDYMGRLSDHDPIISIFKE